MYKVLIADDEKLILEGLQAIIDWQALGLKITATATNGIEALEKFKKEPCDIVITDINMPKLSGLELLASIKKINNNVKFIILSGYDAFEFAKKAIELGVKRYILKPINEEELQQTLQEIIKEFKDIDQHRKELIDQHSKMMAFITGKLSFQQLKKDTLFRYVQPDAKLYSVASFQLEEQYITESNISSVLHNMEQIHYSIAPKDGRLDTLYDTKNSVLLLNSWEEKNEHSVNHYYRTMQQKITAQTQIRSFLAIGPCVQEIECVPSAFKILNQLRKYIMVKGYGYAIDPSYNEQCATNPIPLQVDKLHKYILAKDMKNANFLINQAFQVVKEKKCDVNSLYYWIIRVVTLLQQIIDDFNVHKSDNILEFDELLDTVYTMASLDEIRVVLISQIKAVSMLINQSEIKYTPVVQQVIHYIHENYWEDMNLKTLADKYNINTSYLGQIFIKEVGCSFSKYLNDVKNNKAKDLILNTNMKINDIAKAVGYVDSSYFYKKFKKNFGVSPASLREKKNYLNHEKLELVHQN